MGFGVFEGMLLSLPDWKRLGYLGFRTGAGWRDMTEINGRAVRVGELKESASNRFYEQRDFVRESEGEWDNYYARPPAG